MAEAVFVFGPNIEQHDTAVAQASCKLRGGDRLQWITGAEVLRGVFTAQSPGLLARQHATLGEALESTNAGDEAR
jgi:hypothetical protein